MIAVEDMIRCNDDNDDDDNSNDKGEELKLIQICCELFTFFFIE